MNFVVRSVAAVAALSMITPATALALVPTNALPQRPQLGESSRCFQTRMATLSMPKISAAIKNQLAQCQREIDHAKSMQQRSSTPAGDAASASANASFASVAPVAAVVGATVVAGAVIAAATNDKSN